MSHREVIRAFVAGVTGLLVVVAGHARSSHAILPDESVSYTQPANALVMRFDAGETSESFLTASNIREEDVVTHWVFWSESCDHLVDVWTCLTRNDTIVVDPRNVQATGPDNEKVGPPADLSGERGFVVVTAYEADSACTAGSPATLPVDDALVGSYTLADTTTSYAYEWAVPRRLPAKARHPPRVKAPRPRRAPDRRRPRHQPPRRRRPRAEEPLA